MSVIEKIIKNKITTIGRHRYCSLKQQLSQLNQNSTEELVRFRKLNKISVADAEREVEKYDRKGILKLTESEIERKKEYLKRVLKKEVKKKKFMTKEWLFNEFDRAYFLQNSVKYSQDKTSLENLKPLLYYFIGDFENFKKCSHLSKISVPSFKKGLLIIGGYGNGKTSVMKAFETVLKNTNVTFKMYSANEIVSMYEGCESAIEKKDFKRKVEVGTRYFDDVLTERMASNYGKSNLIKDILEERYNKGKRTYITLNYKDNTNEDLMTGISQLGEKYGSRVFDRLYAMFNIIEFKGKSFRR